MQSPDPTVLEFLHQFEPDGADFRYRLPAAQEPVPVTAAERQAFLDDFNRHAGSLKWILIGGIVASTVFMLADMSILHVWHGFYFVMAGYVASFAVYFFVSNRLRRAPERVLRNRIPAGTRLNWFQRYQRSNAAISWWELLSNGLFLVLIVATQISGQDLTGGWNRLWLVVGAVLFVLYSFRLIQKLRISFGKQPG